MGCQLQLGGRWGRGAVEVLMGKGLMERVFFITHVSPQTLRFERWATYILPYKYGDVP